MFRAYASHPLYVQLENLLSEIYQSPVLVTPTVKLGQISALPVLVGDDDTFVLDMHVHNSVQMAAQLLKAKGMPVTMHFASLAEHNLMVTDVKKNFGIA